MRGLFLCACAVCGTSRGGSNGWWGVMGAIAPLATFSIFYFIKKHDRGPLKIKWTKSKEFFEIRAYLGGGIDGEGPRFGIAPPPWGISWIRPWVHLWWNGRLVLRIVSHLKTDVYKYNLEPPPSTRLRNEADDTFAFVCCFMLFLVGVIISDVLGVSQLNFIFDSSFNYHVCWNLHTPPEN